MATTTSSRQETMLNINEAALLARRSPETIRRWVWSGKLAACRQGRRLMVSHDELISVIRPQGIAEARSLAEWTDMARQALSKPGRPSVGSAADLVLSDRRRRSEGGVDR